MMNVQIFSFGGKPNTVKRKITVTSPNGKWWTFDDEEAARRMFPDHWDKIKSGDSNYKLEIMSTENNSK